MDDRRTTESLIAVPAWWLRQREVDLHLGTAVPKAIRLLGDRRGHRLVGEETLVELRRGDARDDGPLGLDQRAVGEPHADGAARTDDDALHIAVGFTHPAVVA